MSAEEVEIETIPGLPEDLPPGESVVWQGRPAWRSLAKQTFKVQWLSAYFGLFVVVRFVLAVREHQGVSGAVQSLFAVALAGACLGILCLMSWMCARATVYTITTHRVVLRIGVALPMTWNLPFKRIASADLTVRDASDGDIVLGLTKPNRIAWLHLWPHCAPFEYSRAKPTLRALSEPARVSALLAKAVESWSASSSQPVIVAADAERPSVPASEPKPARWPASVGEPAS